MRLQGRKPGLAMLAAAGAIVALAAGCGSDGPADGGAEGYSVEAVTTMTTASITKPQFVRRVNRICREAWVEVKDNFARQLNRPGDELSESERFAQAVPSTLLAGIDFYIFDNIRGLGAPPGDSREIEAMIGPFQAAVELGWKERWRAHSVPEITRHFSEFNRRARRYGLDDCLVDEANLAGIEA